MAKNYFIGVKVPKRRSRRVSLGKFLTLGSGEGAGIKIADSSLPPVALKFRCQNGVVSVLCTEEAGAAPGQAKTWQGKDVHFGGGGQGNGGKN